VQFLREYKSKLFKQRLTLSSHSVSEISVAILKQFSESLSKVAVSTSK